MSRKLISLIMSVMSVFALVFAGAVQLFGQGFVETFDYANTTQLNANWGTYGQEPINTTLDSGKLSLTSSYMEFFTVGRDINLPSGKVRTTYIVDTWQVLADVDAPLDPFYGTKAYISALTAGHVASFGIYNPFDGSESLFLFGVDGAFFSAPLTSNTETHQLAIQYDGSDLSFLANGNLIGTQAFTDTSLSAVALWVAAPEFGIDAFLGDLSHQTTFDNVSASAWEPPEIPDGGVKTPDTGSTAAMAFAGLVAMDLVRRRFTSATQQVSV